MKKMISLILTAMLMLGAAGCGQRAGNDIHMASSEDELYLSRSEEQSVYGVEAPAASGEPGASPTASGSSQVPESLPQAVQMEQSAPREPAVQMNQTQESPAASGMSHTEVLSSRTVGEVRGVWMSYLTFEPLIKGRTKAQFISTIDETFGELSAFGINTVFVQVRPFGDALYASDYFPWSSYLTGSEGQNPGYDPLSIMCGLADEHNLRIEAWINPYRVRINNARPMSADNQAKKWIAAGNDAALEWNGGVYYNPGSAEARKLIVNGVKEIVRNYNVDGIHFDDYFYPTTDAGFDAAIWKASGTKLSQADWRRENVNTLVREVYAAIKSIDSSCLFGISPQGNIKINYESQYADVAEWLANPGYVDYICPQLYYGYQNGTCPFAETAQAWNDMITADGITLYAGLAPYKLGAVDEWAGAGREEWLNTTDLLAQMVRTARSGGSYGGVVFYSYEALFRTDSQQTSRERANLKKLFT